MKVLICMGFNVIVGSDRALTFLDGAYCSTTAGLPCGRKCSRFTSSMRWLAAKFISVNWKLPGKISEMSKVYGTESSGSSDLSKMCSNRIRYSSSFHGS